MTVKNRCLHLVLLLGLLLGWTAVIPIAVPGVTFADTALPSVEEAGGPVLTEAPTPAMTDAHADLYAGLAALEQAREQGPEAILALTESLRGAALDEAMHSIVSAHRQLAEQAPPRAETLPVSLEEEEAIVQAQAALDARVRARALARRDDAAENDHLEAEQAAIPDATSLASDLTVGNGCTYATIDAAINAASPGDRVLIEGGVTFYENITVNRNLTLQGGYSGCASGSTGRTTINANGSGTAIIVNAGLDVAITNLNITNGSTWLEGGGIRFARGDGTGLLTLAHVDIYANAAQWGGGVWVGKDASLVASDVAIYNNTAFAFGGGIRLFAARATFSDSDIYGNSAPYGGGAHGTLQDGVAPHLNLASYADIFDNDALVGDGLGGGVYMREGTVSLAECSDVYANTAIDGGGLYLITSTLTVASNCSEVMFNTANAQGGGIYAQGSLIELIDGASLYANHAGALTIGHGGGAYLDNSRLSADRAQIYYNTCYGAGGGVYAINGSQLSMRLLSDACFGPRCNQLSYNTADLYGGGVYANNSTVTLRQVYVEGNSALYGGGLYASASSIYSDNALIARNHATSGTGDGIRLFGGASLTGAHNTVAHNDATGGVTGRAIDMSTSNLTLSNSVVWGHASSINVAAQTATCSNVQGGYTGTGNMNVDPLFVNPSVSDFHLQSLSPVIDRCATGQPRDMDNEPRPFVSVRPATPFDMGADEWISPRVGINGGPCAFGSLQQAVHVANPGDVIRAASDTFLETVDIVGKDLGIVGGHAADCVTDIGGTTIIDASFASGSVLDIVRSMVTLNNLEITGGNAIGGGVDADLNSHVTLNNTRVTNNHGTYGAGVYVAGTSVVRLTNGSQVSGNMATVAGGGARVWGRLEVESSSGSIHDNAAPSGGGVSLPGGALDLQSAHVRDNQATGAAGLGGGVHVYSAGIITVTGSANIVGNSAYDGAGIYADDAQLYLEAVVHSNTAANRGGGMYLTNGSVVSAIGTTIGHPEATWGSNQAGDIGGGIYVHNSTIEFSGAIYNNRAAAAGAGLYATSSIITMTDTHVGGPDSYQANRLGPSGSMGVGLYLADGTHATLGNTVVSSNAFQTTGFTYGGGILATNSSVVTMTASSVENHVAPSTGDGRGAGLYLNRSILTLDNSQVKGNTAGTAGGGLRLWNGATLNLLNGSEISDNAALHGVGGGIGASGASDINIADSILRNNTAGTDGGALYTNGGTLDLTGGWALQENAAGRNGGALAVEGTAVANLRAQGYGLVYSNRALGGHGGMLHLANNTTAKLYATSGFPIHLYANSASGNGGALHANSGGMFDIYGQVDFDRNRAANGGAIYLSDGSRAWLDDYVNVLPRLWANRADSGSGGAIYAVDSPRVELDGVIVGRPTEGNQASESGGAIYLSRSSLDADNCTFEDNQAVTHGGAIAAYEATVSIYATYLRTASAAVRPAQPETAGGVTIAAAACDPRVQSCSVFSGNVADSDEGSNGYGGAIYTSDSALQIDHTYLRHNGAYQGGAIYQTGTNAEAQVANSVVYGNKVGFALGAGIRRNGGAFTLRHVTLADNVGGSGFSGVASEVHNSIAWGNDGYPGFATAPVSTSCSIDDGGNAGLNVNPQFVSPGAGQNYRLKRSSPAIDVCATGLAVDLDNVARPYADAYDMGAYEYHTRLIYVPLTLRNR